MTDSEESAASDEAAPDPPTDHPDHAPDAADAEPVEAGPVGGSAQYDTGIYARESPYLERYVQLGMASERLINVSFPEEPDAGSEPDHPLLDRVFAYLEGEEESFADLDPALTVPTDQRGVLETLREVPYGDQVSVEQLARMAGLDAEDESDLQTVRMALDTNPVPLVIPDHRVRDGPSSAPPEVEQRLRSLEGL